MRGTSQRVEPVSSRAVPVREATSSRNRTDFDGSGSPLGLSILTTVTVGGPPQGAAQGCDSGVRIAEPADYPKEALWQRRPRR
jgi:hypothetical protein